MALSDFAGGVNNAIREQLAQRFVAQQYADKLRQQAIDNDRLEREFQSNEELKRAQLEANAQARQAAEQDRQFGLADKLAEQIPGGTVMPAVSPTAGFLRTGGRAGILQDKGIGAPEPPSSLVSPDNEPAQDIAGTIANSPMPTARLVTKVATSKQLDTQADNERQARATDASISAKLEALHQAAEHLRMQGEVNAANILRAKAEADAAQARATATNNKGSSMQLSQAGKTAKSAIETAGPLTDQVMQMILKEAPDIEQNPQKYNTPMNKLESLYQTAKYKTGFYDDTDPRQQLVSLLQPIQAGQYTRSSRSRQMLELALKHMADPTQTLLTQYQRAKELKAIMPEMLEGIVRAEQPVDPNNPLGGSYFDPNRPQPVASHGAAASGGGPAAAGPKIGDVKVFPNGSKGVFDGQGWVKQ